MNWWAGLQKHSLKHRAKRQNLFFRRTYVHHIKTHWEHTATKVDNSLPTPPNLWAGSYASTFYAASVLKLPYAAFKKAPMSCHITSRLHELAARLGHGRRSWHPWLIARYYYNRSEARPHSKGKLNLPPENRAAQNRAL